MAVTVVRTAHNLQPYSLPLATKNDCPHTVVLVPSTHGKLLLQYYNCCERTFAISLPVHLSSW